MLNCAILDDYQGVALDYADWSPLSDKIRVTVFREHLGDAKAVAESLGGFEIICVMRERTPFPASLFQSLPDLKLLITSGMYNQSIDMAAAKECGVTVCGTPSLGFPTTELTWALILAMVRRVAYEDRAMRDGRWQTTIGPVLHGKTLGIVGLGRLGSAVAKIGQAFGMEICAWSQNLTEERCREVGARYLPFDELLSTADIVSIHLKLSDRTRGLIGERELSLMRPDAYLVNTSRGPIVDEQALVAALRKERIAGAALDVYDVEPLPAKHPLRGLKNTVLTPHLGYVAIDNYRGFFETTVEDIAAWIAGKPVNVIGS